MQALDLASHGRATVRPDSDAPTVLGERMVVAVGADAVGPDRFLNCTGTRELLLEASARGIPRLLIADRAKDVEDEAIAAVVAAPPMHRAQDGGEWPLFEEIPLNLVTARISD